MFFGTFAFAEAFGFELHWLAHELPYEVLHKSHAEDVAFMLLATGGIGLFYVTLGLALGFWNMLVLHDLKHAILEKFSWIMILWGGLMFIPPWLFGTSLIGVRLGLTGELELAAIPGAMMRYAIESGCNPDWWTMAALSICSPTRKRRSELLSSDMKKIASAFVETAFATVGKRMTGRCVCAFISSTAASTRSSERPVEPPTMMASVPACAAPCASLPIVAGSLLPGVAPRDQRIYQV